MGVSQHHIGIFVLYSLLVGVFLGIVYDLFRILRIATEISPKLRTRARSDKKHTEFIKCIVVFFQDMIFWLLASVVITIFIFHVNNGRIRGIALFCTLLGFFAYYHTVGRIVIFFAGYIIYFIQMTIKALYCVTLKQLFKFTKWLCRRIHAVYKKIYQKRYTKHRMASLLRDAAKGFK